jgi:hypothetical protein
MGTSANDLDIGVGVHEIPGSGAVVDALRARLAALKADLAQAAAAQNAFNGGSAGVPVASAATVATSAANQAIGAYVRMGQIIDATSEKAVAAFRAEGDALKVDLALLGATDAQIKKIDTTIGQLDQKIGAVKVNDLFAQEGPARFTANINTAIVELERMAQTVDVTSAQSVAAFQKEAEALKADLVLMGATDEQLAKISATVTRFDQQVAARAGKVPVIIPPVPAQTLSSFDAIAPRLRTAANAVSILSIAATTGQGSIQGMAVAAGNLAIGVGSLVTGPVGALVVALGAIVTLVTTAVGLWKESQKTLDATTRAEGEASAARLQRLAGEDAARAASIIRQGNDARKSVEEGKGTAKQKADAIVAINQEQNEKLAALEADRRKKAKDAANAELDELAALQDAFFLRQAEAAREGVKREFEARQRALDEEQRLADRDPDPERRQSRLDAILRARDTAARRQRIQNAQIDKDDAEQRRAAELAANAQLLELLGQNAASQRLTIEAQYDALLKALKEKGVANAPVIARAIFNAEASRIAIDAIAQNVQRVGDASANEISRTTALLNAHALASGEGQRRIALALMAQRDVIAQSIPLLEAQARAFPGNRDTIDKIDAAKTKLLELNLEIDRSLDQFAELKDVGREATGSAIAGFFEGLAHLGGQDKTEIRALSSDLASVRAELNELLAVPAAQRTATTNNRITELRNQIEATTAALDNAKSSITTWRDLFVSALQSIADALVRVSSQMLATAIIERLLGLAVGNGAGAAAFADIDARGIPGVRVIGGHAAGGLIEGPEGTDVIPGMLTRREFVQPRPSVDYYGEGVMEAMRRRTLPREALQDLLRGVQPLRAPTPRSHFNAGGLVESPSANRFGAAPTGGRFEFVFHHDPGVILKTMKSPEGGVVVVTHVRGSGRSLGLND